MQTRLLLSIIVALTFMIFLAASFQIKQTQDHSEISDKAALCSAYYHYVDDVRKTIDAVDKLCWRTVDPPTN